MGMDPSKRDRKFMEIAVDEMRKSRPEHTHKFDPLVGAVLVGRDGDFLGATHRGALRVGDHAEYTLIERLLGDKKLEGSTLYVTLEPCTSRRSEKMPCAQRIVSARVGRVVIGMPDPNPDIEGHGITYLLNNLVSVDFFDWDLVEQIKEENKGFIEQYDLATEAIEEPGELPEGASQKEKESVLLATLEDLSPEAIRQYLTARGKSLEIPSANLWNFLHRNGFVAAHGDKRSYVPTVAGLLLFGSDPEDFLPQCSVKAEAKRGGRIHTADIAGPLLSLPDRIRDFLDKHMTTSTEINRWKRVEVPEYSWDALREAVINALAHRDYELGAHITIQMLEESIAIRSPGHLLHPLTLDKVRAYNAPAYSRNPRITQTLCYMKLMEERGWGFPRMRDLSREHGLPLPRFTYHDSYFVVTFFARERVVKAPEIASALLGELNERQRRILDILLAQGRITRSECMEKLAVSRDTARRDFNRLMDLGIIQRKGRGRNIHYVLIGA